MNKKEYNELIEKGFDYNKFENFSRVTLLMLRVCEDMTVQAEEYLEQFGLNTVGVKNVLESVDTKLNKVASKFKLPEDKANDIEYMKSYDDFYKYIENYIDKNYK